MTERALILSEVTSHSRLENRWPSCSLSTDSLASGVRKLREEIMRGQIDQAIQVPLLRLNQVLAQEVGDWLATSSSCSGHVNDKGDLYIPTIGPFTNWKQLTVPEVLRRFERMRFEYEPHLFFQHKDAGSSADNRTRWRAAHLFVDALLGEVIAEVNVLLNRKAIVLTPRNDNGTRYELEYHCLCYNFHLPRRADAYTVLKCFWDILERKLTRFDGIKEISSKELRDFVSSS